MMGMPSLQAIDLSRVGAGFGDPALGSQAVFRAVLRALSQPGTVQALSSDAEHPPGSSPGAAAVLLALADSETSVWLAPGLRATAAGAWLRFHTGCRLVEQAELADFAWADAGELPPLGRFAQGSEFEPEHSTTCIVQVGRLQPGAPGWRLRGPGIREVHELAVTGLPGGFAADWNANADGFPTGVDLLLCAGLQIAGLSRTTRIED